MGNHWRPDYRTVGFTLAMVVMQTMAVVMVASGDIGALASQEPYGDPQDVGTLGNIGLIAAAEVLAIAGLYKLYGWLPEWVQEAVKATAVTGIVFAIGLALHVETAYAFSVVIGVFIACMFLAHVVSELDLTWLAFNLIAIYFGAVLAVVLATALSPWLVVLLTATLTVLDPIGVLVFGYIQRFAFVALDIGLPIGVVVPEQWRFPLDELGSDMDSLNASLIGLGDYTLPLAFAVAVNRLVSGAAVTVWGYGMSTVMLGALAGAVAGTMFLSGRFHTHDDAIPALPAMMAWVLVGTGIGVLA